MIHTETILRKIAKFAVKYSCYGISNEKLNEIECKENILLPEKYRVFQSYLGKSLEIDGFIQYPDIIGYRDELQKEAEQDGVDFDIPKNAILLRTFDGIEFWYIVCDGNQNPDVTYYNLDEGVSSSTKTDLDSYYSDIIEKLSKYYERLMIYSKLRKYEITLTLSMVIRKIYHAQLISLEKTFTYTKTLN
ncbi:SMI1/KNR4 family protein [Thaumasiovibrio subtropicus]|uniref:SMI1/KNR4 family protein n=1 Tax=Thaumasiovibrio subtropicus TaxID=1891207 RepID=UPI000B350D81|nr:SMI1/KNR4 family protein [Thaumasiovibrio subtropicus]